MGRPPKKYHWTTIYRKYDDFEFTESDWKAIESECNYAFDKSTHDHILKATRFFLMMAEGERNAPFMYPLSPQSEKTPKLNAAEIRLKKIKASVRDLSKVLQENTINSKNKPEFEADHLIMMNCKELPELGGARVMGPTVGRRQATLLLADLLSRFLIACDQADRELKRFKRNKRKVEFFKDGDAWNEWVASIGNILAERGYHVTTALGFKNKQLSLPPFVRLIEALQKCLPAESAPQRASEEALAKAAQRALRASPQDS